MEIQLYHITTDKYGRCIRFIVPGGYIDITDPEEIAAIKKEIAWARKHLPEDLDIASYIEYQINNGYLL